MHHPPSLFLLVGTVLLSAQLPFASAKGHTDICRLHPKTGPCFARFIRWYYNPRARRCLNFIYGGCAGNANNFQTHRQCEHRCARPATVKPGTCPVLIQSDTLCGQFCSTDASCPGEERCCDTSCGRLCLLPYEAINGYCPTIQGGQSRLCLRNCLTDGDCGWGIRIPRKKCCRYGCWQMCTEAEEEHPGMCPRRKVVQTFAPCNDTCRDDRDCPLTQKCCFTGCSLGCLDSVRSNQCQLPPDRGPCRARLRRFFYSPSQKKCLQFFYGGCRGNSNNFKTRKECEETCGKSSSEVCKQPKATGKCLAYSEFFYYNSTLASCEKFASCRCKGNGNWFFTKLECMMFCGHSGKPANSTAESA